jgi:hypothetical protein
MYRANFCVECGDRLTLKSWRAFLGRRLCDHCAERFGSFAAGRPFIVIVLIALAAFAFGRYLRPAPPPLIIQRAANSPLSDAAVEFAAANPASRNNSADPKATASQADDEVYICGARTKKGTPCRRRVHAAGERCFQHKGMPAMLPLEKLTIKPTNDAK